MSNTRQVRKRLRDWVESVIRVDEWRVDHPSDLYFSTVNDVAQAASTATEFPVESLVLQTTGVNAIQASGVFSYQLRYRYPGELALDDLPLNDFESIAEYLQGLALLRLQGGTISSIEVVGTEYPVVIQREEAQQSDWLVFINVQYLVTFAVTELDCPDGFGPEPPAEPSELTRLSLRIYRARAGNLADNTLDAVIELE